MFLEISNKMSFNISQVVTLFMREGELCLVLSSGDRIYLKDEDMKQFLSYVTRVPLKSLTKPVQP